MPKYSKRHYIDIANVLKTKKGKTQVSAFREFSDLFSKDNPLFNSKKFFEAVFGKK